VADFGKKTRKINVTSGEFKSYRVPINLHQHRFVYFYFDTENLELVEHLVSNHLPAIGKKRGSGYGEIESFKIEKIEYNPFEENVIRPIPVEKIENLQEFAVKFGGNFISRYTAYKPPYHQNQNFTDCFMPK
jgi:hypothetical protein